MTEIKYKSIVIGKGGVSARVVAHSKSAYSGKEIVTFEYEMPKCILAELNTHRLFSRNAQSSRAVPISKVIEGIRNNPVTPIYWGSNQAGMVAGEEIDTEVTLSEWDGNYDYLRDDAWNKTAYHVANLMQAWEDAGYHKQIVNRIGEAFTFVRGVITATEFDNFFHLRIHPAADPFIQELARCMWEALQASEADVLYEGEWHLPYVTTGREMVEDENGFMDGNTYQTYYTTQDDGYQFYCTLERAKQISAAACAQVSFRKLDLSDRTVDRVYSRLVDDETPHASCVEHSATPMTEDTTLDTKGVTALHKKLGLMSGNFSGWIQNRQLIENECRWEYKKTN